MPPATVEVVGVVVGRTDVGEHDRVVRLLGPELGRFAVFATAARRPRARAGQLDLGVRARLGVRRTGNLWRLGHLVVEEPRVALRQSYEALVLAAWCAEVASALAQPDHPEPRLYGLLETALLLLDAASAPPGLAFRLAFEAKALTFAGVAPVLDRCAACGGVLDAESRFEAAAGGARHLGCGGGVVVPTAGLRRLEELRRTPLREVLDLGAPEVPTGLLADAIEAHLGRPLRSRAALPPG